MSVFEWAIIAFIVFSILFHVWKGGAANPQSTGKVSKQVSELSTKVTRLDGRVGHVEKGLETLKGEAASTKDIERLEERIETVRAQLDGHKELSAATNRGVERIERILLEKAFEK